MINNQEGIYLYCIIDSDKPREFKTPGIGNRGDKVYTLGFNGLSAVVSRSPQMKYQALRENLMPQELVVEEAMQEFTALPVRFCTIAKSEEEIIEKGLKGYQATLKNLIEKMRGKVELGLRAMWVDMKDIFGEIAQTAEIKRLKSAPKPNLMEIGRRVETLLSLKKEDEKAKLISYFKELAVDYKLNNTYGDRWLLNAAFLVAKSKEKEFDELVNKIDEQFNKRISLKYVGPFAPYNFVNVDLRF